LGFVLSAQNKLDEAISRYEVALSFNPNAWDVLINIGDIYEISGKLNKAISYYKKAFDAINNQDCSQLNQSKQWLASLDAGIGEKYVQLNKRMEAEIWFRHVLSFAPFFPEATIGLAKVLKLTEQISQSTRICREYVERIGKSICD
jgi:tetratricopeptide (TPR) repeat protein